MDLMNVVLQLLDADSIGNLTMVSSNIASTLSTMCDDVFRGICCRIWDSPMYHIKFDRTRLPRKFSSWKDLLPAGSGQWCGLVESITAASPTFARVGSVPCGTKLERYFAMHFLQVPLLS